MDFQCDFSLPLGYFFFASPRRTVRPAFVCFNTSYNTHNVGCHVRLARPILALGGQGRSYMAEFKFSIVGAPGLLPLQAAIEQAWPFGSSPPVRAGSRGRRDIVERRQRDVFVTNESSLGACYGDDISDFWSLNGYVFFVILLVLLFSPFFVSNIAAGDSSALI